MELIFLTSILTLILSVVYYALRYGIGPTPSGKLAIHEMASLSKKNPEGILLELGSGWGTLTFALSRMYPKRRIKAYEISPFPWLCSLFLLGKRKNLSLQRKDFYRVSFEEASVIVCYLYPGVMKMLKEKFEKELRDGAIVISNTFSTPGWKPIQVKQLDDLYRTPIYCYRFFRSSTE